MDYNFYINIIDILIIYNNIYIYNYNIIYTGNPWHVRHQGSLIISFMKSFVSSTPLLEWTGVLAPAETNVALSAEGEC